ncbi:MAG: ankyrin repeat domain-containing protein [Phycisphaerales bacterium]|nr:ankyrin repeat domain-containing protein [Phycisphaerales bacterium]
MTGRKQDVAKLHKAAATGNVLAVRSLLAATVDPDAADNAGLTPLHLAASCGRVAAVRALLDGGAAVDVDSLVFGHEKHDRRVLKLMHDFGLRDAIRKGDQEEVEQFLADGASVAARDVDLCTPLHMAASVGNARAARALIDRGAEIDARDAGGETPLHKAAAQGASELVELLVSHGADASARDLAGMTPEHYARTLGRQAVAVRLRELAGKSTPAR